MTPLDGDELRSLVEAAKGGDDDAFEALYRGTYRLVHGVLLATLPYEAVEDLAQEVFMTAYQKLAALRDSRSFGCWIATIARNRATDWLRTPRAVPLPDDVPEPSAPPDESREILALIHRLPEAYREPLTLRLVEGMSGPEISRETGLTEGSVRVNLHRGMKMLRELLGDSR